jgi:hypothetical protein
MRPSAGCGPGRTREAIASPRNPLHIAPFRPSSWRTPGSVAGHPSCGIRGSGRVCPAISGAGYAQDERKPAGVQPRTRRKDMICRDYGSDGTRTRDLRRDRPVLPLRPGRGLAWIPRREQVFPPVLLRGLPGACGSFRRPLAGSARDEIVVQVDNAAQPKLLLRGRAVSPGAMQSPLG